MHKDLPHKPTVLITDDDVNICSILRRCLDMEGYAVSTVHSGEEAMEALSQAHFDLLVSDLMMPGISGLELLDKAKIAYPDMAVLMITGVDDRSTALEALKKGAFGYIIKPFDLNELLIQVVNVLERRRLAMESLEYEKRLEEEVSERISDLRCREEEIALRLVSAAEYRDNDTGEHIRRLGLFAAELARAIGWSAFDVDDIRVAATMHDIGKIGIPDTILLKAGKLEQHEFETIKTHTEIGAGILTGSNIPLLKMAKEIALYHHEKWDGSGYPNGRKGEDIPESARIVAVVDVFDAMAYDRVYRPAFAEEKVLGIMRNERGRHFDPRILDIFLTIFQKIREIKQQVDSETAP